MRIEVVAWLDHPSLRAGLLEIHPEGEDAQATKRNVELNPNENHRFASSVYNNDPKGIGHNMGMLDGNGGWCAAYKHVGEWYVMDTGMVRMITGVVTQPRGNALHQMFTEYKVLVSDEPHGPFKYVDDGFVFKGNTAWTHGKVENVFAEPVMGRYVRIELVSFSNHPCMRAGVLVGE